MTDLNNPVPCRHFRNGIARGQGISQHLGCARSFLERHGLPQRAFIMHLDQSSHEPLWEVHQ